MAGWITINGTHVFVKDGESVEEAFKSTTGKDMHASAKEQLNTTVNNNIKNMVSKSKSEIQKKYDAMLKDMQGKSYEELEKGNGKALEDFQKVLIKGEGSAEEKEIAKKSYEDYQKIFRSKYEESTKSPKSNAEAKIKASANKVDTSVKKITKSFGINTDHFNSNAKTFYETKNELSKLRGNERKWANDYFNYWDKTFDEWKSMSYKELENENYAVLTDATSFGYPKKGSNQELLQKMARSRYQMYCDILESKKEK